MTKKDQLSKMSIQLAVKAIKILGIAPRSKSLVGHRLQMERITAAQNNQ